MRRLYTVSVCWESVELRTRQASGFWQTADDMTVKQRMAIDRAAAKIQERLLESVATDIRKPWFVVIRSELVKLARVLAAKPN